MRLLFLLTCVLLSLARAAPANGLAEHPSPYLSLHGDDPVDWRVWDKSAVDRAREDDRLLFVSIGYFSCHWCHVMHRESYRDAQIAEVMNNQFVPVKVDRELQPALDSHLMAFVQATRGHGGWPLNVFITPEGHPLTGMTYLPPDQFLRVLTTVNERWQAQKPMLKKAAADAARMMQRRRSPARVESVSTSALNRYRNAFVTQALQIADRQSGGFGRQMKFPSVPQLMVLIEMQRSVSNPELDAFLQLTLRQMRTQGMRDQLGGGFFRYSTDAEWQVPHFEKMLYDNALLAELYVAAADYFGDKTLEAAARDTLDFMLRELRSPDGAFIASLSSLDEKGTEGGYYLWDRETLLRVLSAQELAIAERVWGFEGPPGHEHGYVPVQAFPADYAAARLGLDTQRTAELLASAREKLLAERAGRTLPRDVKQLAGWNGLALSALVAGAGLEDGERYARAARRLRDYLQSTLWAGNELLRARDDRGRFGDASLQDYAYVAHGLLRYAQLSGQQADFKLVLDIVEQAWRRFYSEGGWRLAEDMLIPYGDGELILSDGAMPSPSALLLGATLAVAERIEDAALRERIEAALRVPAEELEHSAFHYASHLAVLSRHLGR